MQTIPWIKWQSPMIKVLYALIPVMFAAVFFFGWRCLTLMAVVMLAAYLTEYAFTHLKREPVTSAVFVSAALYAFTLPPNLPLWMAATGIIFGIVFGKMAFGGFGRNIFNPAITGRVFIYINFATPMNADWVNPLPMHWERLGRYAADAVCGATPMQVMKTGGNVPLLNLFLGNTAGCMGETCALLLILGGIYIIWTKAANYRLTVSCIIGAALLQSILFYCGVKGALPVVPSLLSGGFMLGAIYMVTDPVSAPKTNSARWIYGGLIGLLTVVIRTFSIWPEGMMFAILLGNMFGPLIDLFAERYLEKKRRA